MSLTKLIMAHCNYIVVTPKNEVDELTSPQLKPINSPQESHSHSHSNPEVMMDQTLTEKSSPSSTSTSTWPCRLAAPDCHKMPPAPAAVAVGGVPLGGGRMYDMICVCQKVEGCPTRRSMIFVSQVEGFPTKPNKPEVLQLVSIQRPETLP